MRLKTLLEEVKNYQVICGSEEVEVTELIYDTRKQIVSGSVFVCISGAVHDGHAYVEKAVKDGAVAIIAEHRVEVPENVCLVIPPFSSTITKL